MSQDREIFGTKKGDESEQSNEEEELDPQEIMEESLDLLKYKYSKYGPEIKQELGGDQAGINPKIVEQSIAKIMKIAGFVIEGPDENVSIKDIVIQIGDLSREFCVQKKLEVLTVQQVCALIATFIRRGEGSYEALNTNEESDEEGEDTEEENEEDEQEGEELKQEQTEGQGVAYHLNQEVKVTDGSLYIEKNTQDQDPSKAALFDQKQEENNLTQSIEVQSQKVQVDGKDHYYNFEDETLKLAKDVTLINSFQEDITFDMVYEIEQNEVFLGVQQKYSGVFEYISEVRLYDEQWMKPNKAYYVPINQLELKKLQQDEISIVQKTKPVLEKIQDQTYEAELNEMKVIDKNNISQSFGLVNDDEKFMNENSIYIQRIQAAFEIHDRNSDGIDDNRIIFENEIHLISQPNSIYEILDQGQQLKRQVSKDCFCILQPLKGFFSQIQMQDDQDIEQFIGLDEINSIQASQVQSRNSSSQVSRKQSTQSLASRQNSIKIKRELIKIESNQSVQSNTSGRSNLQQAIETSKQNQKLIEITKVKAVKGTISIDKSLNLSFNEPIKDILYAGPIHVKNPNQAKKIVQDIKPLRISRSLNDIQQLQIEEENKMTTVKTSGRNKLFETPPRQPSENEFNRTQTQQINFQEEDQRFGEMFTSEEEMILADESMREIFVKFAKSSSNVAGHHQTFDRLAQGYECLNLRDLIKILKQYNIAMSKQKIQFLFKKYSTMGTFIDFNQFKQILKHHFIQQSKAKSNEQKISSNIMTNIYGQFSCYPISKLLNKPAQEMTINLGQNKRSIININNVNNKEANINFNAIKLRKILQKIMPQKYIKLNPGENLYSKRVDKRTLLDEDYQFRINLRKKLREKRENLKDNLAKFFNQKFLSRNHNQSDMSQRNLSEDIDGDNPYTNNTFDGINENSVQSLLPRNIKKPLNVSNLNIKSFQTYTDEHNVDQPSAARYKSVNSRGSNRIVLPAIKQNNSSITNKADQQINLNNLNANNITVIDDMNDKSFGFGRKIVPKSNANQRNNDKNFLSEDSHQNRRDTQNLFIDRNQLNQIEDFQSENSHRKKSNLFKERCAEKMAQLDELGKSYSENDAGQFHLDSLPAILAEMMQVIEILLVDKSKDSQSDDQEIEVLDKLFEYIQEKFKSQFINDQTIMFAIEDIITLTDRFTKDLHALYEVVDIRKKPETPPKSIQLENSKTGLIEYEAEYNEEWTGNQDEKSESDKESSESQNDNYDDDNFQDEVEEPKENISEFIKEFIPIIQLPSPKFGNIQYFAEESEEQEQVITLDDGLFMLNQDSSNESNFSPQKLNQNQGLSIREVIQQTIIQYQQIIDLQQYKDEDDKQMMLNVIQRLKQQLNEEDLGSQFHTNGSQLRIEESSQIESPQRDENLDNKGDQIMLIKDENQFQIFVEEDLLLDGKKMSNLSPEEQKLQNLQEIFLIYCRQHVLIGKNPTFDDIKKEVRNLNLGEFIKFCKDFSINLSKEVIMKIFKKTAVYSREMYFTNFKIALVQLMKELNQVKIDKCQKEFKEIKQALKVQNQNKNENAEGKSNEDQAQQLKSRLEKIKAEEQQLKLSNEDEQCLYKYATDTVIEVHDPSKYRKKIKGFTLAFGIKDRQQKFQDLLGESISQQNQLNSAKQEYTFKPFLYKDNFKKKISSVNITKQDMMPDYPMRDQSPMIQQSQLNNPVSSQLQSRIKMRDQQFLMNKPKRSVPPKSKLDSSFMLNGLDIPNMSIRSLERSKSKQSKMHRARIKQNISQTSNSRSQLEAATKDYQNQQNMSDDNSGAITSKEERVSALDKQEVNSPQILKSRRSINPETMQPTGLNTRRKNDIKDLKDQYKKVLDLSMIIQSKYNFDNDDFISNLIDLDEDNAAYRKVNQSMIEPTLSPQQRKIQINNKVIIPQLRIPIVEKDFIQRLGSKYQRPTNLLSLQQKQQQQYQQQLQQQAYQQQHQIQSNYGSNITTSALSLVTSANNINMNNYINGSSNNNMNINMNNINNSYINADQQQQLQLPSINNGRNQENTKINQSLKHQSQKYINALGENYTTMGSGVTASTNQTNQSISKLRRPRNVIHLKSGDILNKIKVRDQLSSNKMKIQDQQAIQQR